MITNASEAAVTTQELTQTFGDFTAVDRVSFTVRTGEIFAFLGPNGAGKTTTIRMLAGLLSPSSGQGVVAGFDLYTQRRQIKRSIGYMSQLFSLYADLTVDENIRLFAGLYGVPREKRAARRTWVLEMAGLTGRETRRTGELPLGWKQRLALGCAVLHEPPILFLDEPTSGVDPTSRRQFWDLIYQLADGGTSVLVSTHYMEEAEYAHRLALMNRGKLIALNTPDALRDGMREPILEVRVDDAPRAAEALQGAPGIVEVAMYGRALHVVVEDPDAARSEIPTVLESHGIRAPAMDRIEPSLEDVFVSLVRAEGGAPVE